VRRADRFKRFLICTVRAACQSGAAFGASPGGGRLRLHIPPPRVSLVRGSNASAMEVSETIQCPFCGQAFVVVIDTSTAFQRFTTDCEVCCRPVQVRAECEPGEILSLDVQAE
jgi:hypothetical protein